MYTFSLDDICRAKVVPVEIKDDADNVEGVVYLREPSAVEGAKLQESITTELPWHTLVMGILALTLSDDKGNLLVNSPADRKKLESMPPRMLIALRDPCLEMLSMSWSAKNKKEIATDSEDIDTTLANLDDQVAAAYRGEHRGEPELSSDDTGVESTAVPIEGNENLHLDQDPSENNNTQVDPSNPFVVTVEVPS